MTSRHDRPRPRAEGSPPGQSAGPAIDRSGQPVVDPTRNVLDLVDAAIARQDDLRSLSTKVFEANMRRIDDMAELRSEHSAELRDAEARRLDAIRSVDIAAVSRAADVSAEQAATLARQVTAVADTVRLALETALIPMRVDIADLRRAQYEAQGQKTQVVEARNTTGAVYAAIGIGVSLLLALITVAGFLATRTP